MGMYYSTRYLNYYLNKCKSETDKRRPLEPEECLLVDKLGAIRKEMGILIAEILTIVAVLRFFTDPNLRFVIRNLDAMVGSLKKQRDLASRIRMTYLSLKPNEREHRDIEITLTRFEKRISYLRSMVIPSNLKMTPLNDYLEINGRLEMRDDIHDWLGDIYDIIETNESGEVSFYAEHIINTLSQAGRQDSYKELLSKYAEEREGSEKDKKASKQAMDYEKATEGLMHFCSLFNDAKFNIKNNDSINFSINMLEQMIAKHGIDCYFVLCCGIYRAKPVYRYLGDGDQLVNVFSRAHAFRSEAAATKARDRVAVKYPDKAFGVESLK